MEPAGKDIGFQKRFAEEIKKLRVEIAMRSFVASYENHVQATVTLKYEGETICTETGKCSLYHFHG